MAIDEHTRNEITERARQWMLGQDLPRECPREDCMAVERWRLGNVGEISSVTFDKELGRAVKDLNPNARFVVPIECEWCGNAVVFYEE